MSDSTRQRGRGVFIKHHGKNVVADYSRVKRLWKVCHDVDGLVAPKPLWIDEDKGDIGYTKFEGLVPLISACARKPDLMSETGRLLAKLHLATSVEGSVEKLRNTFYPINSFGFNSHSSRLLHKHLPLAYFHGDCWHGNIFMHGCENIVILDPIPNFWIFDSKHIWANGAIDLAMLHMSIYLCHSALSHLRHSLDVYSLLADNLLAGYFGAIGNESESVRRAVLSLSREISRRHVLAYRERLSMPIATLKTHIGNRIMKQLDQKLQWNQ